jgi:Protein of unknown function (DUF3370)
MFKRLSSCLVVALTLSACQSQPDQNPNIGGSVADELPATTPLETGETPHLQTQAIASSAWTSGALTTSIVPVTSLKNLEGGLSGSRIWKSNNPEVIKGNGWLMQNARTDATRGGAATPLTGTNAAYLFHINKSGVTRYVHILVTNPNNSSITISGKGSAYTNADKPLNGSGTGPSYAVSSDWLANTPRTTFNSVTVGSKQAYQVYRATLSNGALMDGRFEITSSAGVYVYTVVTSSGTLTDAINASQGGPAAGDIFSPAPDKFGREAGVYASSAWTGTTSITIPASSAHLGIALNTSAKNPSGPSLQEQTAPAVMRLSDSAERTYGNYGHLYDFTLALSNPNSSARTVRLSLASNITGTTDVTSFTFNTPVSVNGSSRTVFLKPTAPKQVLATWTVPANSPFNARVKFYVPGLITIGQQLILENL